MAGSVVSSLRPGYISGREAARRIAAVMAGPGIKLQDAGWTGFWFISKDDGRLMIQQDMTTEINKMSYLRLSCMEAGLIRKNQIIASCRITQNIVPETGVDRLESVLAEKGCVMSVQSMKMEPVGVSLVGQNNILGFFMRILEHN